MKFRAHETFFIRKGWINKGLKNVTLDEYIFTSKDINPGDVLGIGTNMVKSLRYWLQALDVTKEPRSGKRNQRLTSFGTKIYEHDRYIEEMGTLCLLHYKLAKNEELATSWHYFFNEFNMSEFTKDDFVLAFKNKLRLMNVDVAERSLEDDFNCIINTYIPRSILSPEKQNPESNIDCPLGEIGLVSVVDRKKKIYKKSAPGKGILPPIIALAVIIDNIKENKKEILISELQNGANNIGKVYNLDIIALMDILHTLENMGYIEVIRTAGLDLIRIKNEYTFEECIELYYVGLDH